MKIRLLCFVFLLVFTFIGKVNAQVTISNCATPGSINVDANCEAIVPDFTSQVMADDPVNFDPINVTQDPVPGTIVSSGDVTITFRASNLFGSDICQAVLAVTDISAVCMTNVPDDSFEQALIDLGYDSGPLDDYVPTVNINTITSLSVASKNIADFTGIGDFTSLTQLVITSNVHTTIDVTGLSNLEELETHNNNNLTSINVTGLTKLKLLRFNSTSVKSIDISTNVALEELWAFRIPSMTEMIDTSNNPELWRVLVQKNSLVGILDLRHLTKLTWLSCQENSIRGLNVRNGNNANTTTFEAQDSPNLTCIEVDDATAANAGTGNYAGWVKDIGASYSNECLTNVPDDNFEQALIDAGYDTGALDNFVPTANISGVEGLIGGSGGQLFNKGIIDLTGIEDFVSLKQLISNGNPLTSIDLSGNTALENLQLSDTQLTDLDLSANTKLLNVNITDNQLETIDLSGNTVLTNLRTNSPLTALDLSANTALKNLGVRNSLLNSIDLSANTALTNLILDNNPLTGLNLSANVALTDVSITNTPLASLDLSANIALESLECTNNQLANLDLSANTALEELYSSDNKLTSLDLSVNDKMQELEADSNQLTFLNVKNGGNLSTFSYISVTNNPNLSCIEVDDVTAANAGTGNYGSWEKDATASYSEACRTNVPDDNFEQALIDLGYDSGALDDYVPTAKIAGVTELSVRYDNIVDLTGIEDFVSLTTLRCDNNDIIDLDLSANTALTDVRCHDNPLGTLDLSANTLLTRVDAFRTELTSINLTGLTQLSILKVNENLFSTINLSTNTDLTELSISENNALTSLDVSSNTELVKLYGFECQIGSLDLSTNTKIEVINIRDNQLTTLDVSANTVLESLNVEDNQLTSIDLSANTSLRLLYLDNNQLTSLDLSTNTNLTRLECENNKLVSLDVKNGSSASISTLRSTSNFDLNCIEVDDPTAANAGTGNYGNWLKDDSTAFADGCVPFTHVPDDNFEQVLIDLALDDVLDNFVVTSNITGVTTLDLNTKTITDVTGIEDFAALTTLNVNDNQITRLDLKQNTALTSIQANNNQLQFFSVKNGNNANVTTFSATGNADLLCIEVDDETGGYLSTWQKDATASFGTVCTACVVDGTSIASQAEFDQFVALLGTCNTVNGDLTIRNANDITDVSALSSIEVINGNLFIADNELITNLDGLENLTMVTDGISLSRNDALDDISALSGIVNPTASISISDNAALTDITAVLDFAVTEFIYINGQTLTHALTFPNVTTLTGTNTNNSSGPGSVNFTEVTATSINFPNLTTIEHYFTLRDVAINTVSFPLLTSVGRSFRVDGAENTAAFNFNVLQTVDRFTFEETSVTDLSSFAVLTSLGTYVSIEDNPNLTSLDALGNVVSTSGMYMYFRNNTSLTSLDGLEFVSGANEIIVIENNPVLTNIDGLQAVTAVGYFQILNNIQLANVDGFSNLTETTETDSASYLHSIMSGNAITSFNLTNLRTVGNQLNIVETGVTNFCGLYSYVADGDGQTTLDLTGSTFTVADILNCENVAPVITLIGDNPQTIIEGAGYTELGAETDDGSDVVTDATNFVDVVGSYTITYNATNASGMASAVEVTRTVNVVDITAPIITVTGDNPQTLERGTTYIELGAITDDGSNVVINASAVNINIAGSYEAAYNATDASGNTATEVIRTVNVVDTTVPVITLTEANPQTIELGSGYTELGATTDDGVTNVVIDTSDFVDAIGSYTIRYNATDASSNTATEVIRTVNVVDTTVPVIMLTGANPQTIELGFGYTELGATTDDGSNVTIDTSDFIDAVGSYTIRYDATDASGNAATQVTRTVNVEDTTVPVITLTGDNPQTIELGSGYTELGATTDDGSTIVIDTSDFTDAVGSYMVRYNATDASGNAALEVPRMVNVVDTTVPVITLTGDNPQTIEFGSGYAELGATIDDGSNVTIDTSDFTDAIGNYTIRYNATDASGNTALEVTRTVNVIDTTSPIIMVTGDNPQTIELGSGYIELGATTDDGSTVTIDTSDFVDAIGGYTITYNATDASGNVATEVIRIVNVSSSCPIYELPSDNFQIVTSSETCTDKNNGIITINASEEFDYTTTINNEAYSFRSSLEIANLAPGTYPVCIAIDGFTNCEQCFELVIEEAETLAGKTAINTDSTTNKMDVAIDSGTAPYTVMINNEIIGAYDSNSFSVEVKNGDTVDVFSSLVCEGKLSTKIDLFEDVRAYPNPTRSNVDLMIPNTGSTTMAVEIRNALGAMISSKEYSIIDNKVTLAMDSLPQGIYFVQINEGTPRTFKIVKQ